MSILIVNETFKDRKTSEDEKGVRKYTRTYRVITDSLSQSKVSVKAAPGVRKYQRHPEDNGAVAKSISAKQDSEQGFVWEVTVDYDSAPFDANDTQSGSEPSDQKDNNQEPELRPWKWSFSSRKTTKPALRDNAGDAIVTSSKQPYVPVIEIPCSNPVINIELNKPVFNPAKTTEYQDAINSVDWKIAGFVFPARTLRVTNYQANTNYEKGILNWAITLELEQKTDGWNPIRLLDAGTIEAYTAPDGTGQHRNITDNHGHPVSSPVPLDGFGKKLAFGGTLVYRTYNVYTEKDFKNLI